ncbi:MAG: hypothetical protein GPJ54_00925 [Candidatus Heimdallarchaeota archaeon]|nr:hypothetical protein [Candidatus Heimdallarchaeota archaeon]
MSYSRKRFLSIWNGVATIIFFGGIFLGFSYLGFSGLTLGIFMWIIGGVIAGMLFGPSKSKERRSRKTRRYDRSIDVPVEHSHQQNQFCIACGTEFPINDQFCPQCGTAGTNKVTTN